MGVHQIGGGSKQDGVRITEIEAAGDFGRSLASILGGALPIEDPFARVGVSAVIATLGENLAEAVVAGGVLSELPSGEIYNVLNNALSELGENIISAGSGAISSILVADLIDSLGLEGTLVGEVGADIASAYLSTIIENIVHLQNPLQGLGDINPGAIVATYFGGKLADEIVEFDTVGGQIGAAIGEGVGGIVAANILKAAAATANPYAIIAAVIVVAILKIFGGLIGSLFGGTPKAGAALGWDPWQQQFETTRVWSKNGGSREAVSSFANSVVDVLNGIISASGSIVLDPCGVQVGAYEMKGRKFIYKPSASGNYAFTTSDPEKLISHGAFIALSDLSGRLTGGDVFVKRALLATLKQANGDPDSDQAYSAGEFDFAVLMANIATAVDYEKYLENASTINALIAAAPDSVLAANWAITFARIIELGLDKRWASDWTGGLP